MRLQSASQDLSGRNGSPLRKITKEELSLHNTQFDCWTVYQGKVYNITQYLHYHPGGIPKIMQGAGKDCTHLFKKYHHWVNCESMLDKCLVGFLMLEHESIPEDKESAEDISDDDPKLESSKKQTSFESNKSAILAKALENLNLDSSDDI